MIKEGAADYSFLKFSRFCLTLSNVHDTSHSVRGVSILYGGGVY